METLDFEEIDKILEKCEKWEEAYPKLVDFVRYAMHETMLPHHFHPEDNNWRSQRVCGAAQKLLNELGEEQSSPENYTLIHNEEYWEERKHKEPKDLEDIFYTYVAQMPTSHLLFYIFSVVAFFIVLIRFL